MTNQLQKAIDLAATLSAEDQNAIAAVIIEELRSEQRWNELFAKPADKLEELAEQALKENRAGETLPLDADAI
ncbi:MAG: hypothetical protein AAGG46_05165 [Planctomycetota bacterium]